MILPAVLGVIWLGVAVWATVMHNTNLEDVAWPAVFVAVVAIPLAAWKRRRDERADREYAEREREARERQTPGSR